MRGHGGHGNWTFREVLWCKGVLMKSGARGGACMFCQYTKKGEALTCRKMHPLHPFAQGYSVCCNSVCCGWRQEPAGRGSACVYACVRMCVCLYACVCVGINTCVCVCEHACVCMCMCVRTCVCQKDQHSNLNCIETLVVGNVMHAGVDT